MLDYSFLSFNSFDIEGFSIKNIIPDMDSKNVGIFENKKGQRKTERLLFVEKGMGFFEQNSQKIVAEKGSVVYIPSDEPYRLYWKNGSDGAVNVFVISYVLSNKERINFDNKISIIAKGEMYKNYFLNIFDEYKGAVPFSKIKSISLFLEMLYYILSYEVFNGSIEGIKDIEPAIGYINENIRKKITEEELCRVCHTSPATLRRRFNEFKKMSPMKYVVDRKMKLAYEIIENTNLTLSEIAEMFAFSDSAHFSRMFKEIYNVSPGKIRKK